MFPIHDDNQRLHGRPYVNYTLIFINVVVFIWEIVVTDFFTNEQATMRMLLNYGATPIFILQGDIPSLFTSMFMHAGVAHIVGNMVFLFVFGDNIEDRFGHIKYLLIYLMWGVAAAYIHSIYVVEVLGIESGLIPAVGASGAISGVLGAYLLVFPRARIFTVIIAFFITTIRIPALAYIPFWFVLQIVFGFIDPLSGIGYLAHIGGFIAGVVTGLLGRKRAGIENSSTSYYYYR